MFNHRFDQNADNLVVAHWFLLSFNGGFINAGGFLATGRFVSHVTGFATLFGVRLGDHDAGAAFGILSVPVFFLLGAFLAGMLIDRPLYRGQKPHFDWVMGLSSLCLVLAAGCERLFHLGLSGHMIALEEGYVLLGLLCLASGLQNAAITSSSGRSVRTTHLTGLTTDLGLGIARVFTFPGDTDRGRAERRANFLRLGSILAFVLGSAVGARLQHAHDRAVHARGRVGKHLASVEIFREPVQRLRLFDVRHLRPDVRLRERVRHDLERFAVRGEAGGLDRADDPVDVPPEHRIEQHLLVLEVLVQRADRYPRALGHPGGGQLAPAVEQQNLKRCFENGVDGDPRARLLRRFTGRCGPSGVRFHMRMEKLKDSS